MVMLSGYVDPALRRNLLTNDQLNVWMNDLEAMASYTAVLQTGSIGTGRHPDSGFKGTILRKGDLLLGTTSGVQVLQAGNEGDILAIIQGIPTWVGRPELEVLNNIQWMVL